MPPNNNNNNNNKPCGCLQETICAEKNRIKLFDRSRKVVVLIGGIEAHAAVAVALRFVLFVLDEPATFALNVAVWRGCKCNLAGRARSQLDVVSFGNGLDCAEKALLQWPLMVVDRIFVAGCLNCSGQRQLADLLFQSGLGKDHHNSFSGS